MEKLEAQLAAARQLRADTLRRGTIALFAALTGLLRRMRARWRGAESLSAASWLVSAAQHRPSRRRGTGPRDDLGPRSHRSSSSSLARPCWTAAITLPDLIVLAFAASNSVRVLAYVPRILRIACDQGGAIAVSRWTWALFALSHLTTVLYAVAVAKDPLMALMFGVNAVACGTIVVLTWVKRRRHGALPASSHAPAGTAPDLGRRRQWI